MTSYSAGISLPSSADIGETPVEADTQDFVGRVAGKGPHGGERALCR